MTSEAVTSPPGESISSTTARTLSSSRACCKAARMSSTIESPTLPGSEELIRPRRDDRDLVVVAALHNRLAESGRRLFLPRTAAQAADGHDHEDEIHHHARAERDEQKDAETAEFSIGSHDRANLRRTDRHTRDFPTLPSILHHRCLRSPVARNVLFGKP